MTARRKQRQGHLRRVFVCGIVLLTIFLVSRNLAGSDTPALHLYPLFQPNTLAPASEPLEADPDPRAIELAERLRLRLAGLQAAAPFTPQLTPGQSQALSELETRCPGEVSVVLRPLAGTPRQIKGEVLQQVQHGSTAGSDSQLTTARTFLRTNCDLLRLDDPHAELVLVQRQTDELGRTHLRFQQEYRGVPVWPADVIVHLNPEGHVDVMNGVFVPTPKKLGTVPVLDAATAAEYARTGLTDGAEAEVSASELIIYAPGDTPPRLAWKLELAIDLTSRWLVVIDAVTGAELTAYSLVMHQQVAGSGVDLFGRTRPLNVWQQDGLFWMVDTSKRMFDPRFDWNNRGAIWIYDARNQELESPHHSLVPSFSPTSGWLPDTVSASHNLSQAYDYYLERHNRNSFDDQGASIPAIVRIGGEHQNNAFWTGSVLGFGDGLPFAGALDVVGHELTHAVIQYSANLIYQNQPGALNESFSDIFGEMIEARTAGRPDWLIGQALGDRRFMRNMANPAALAFDGHRPYPTKMSEFFYTHEDDGGVHINSSIINRAFYLLAAGLNGAVGLRAAERIFYRALTVHLVQNSQFVDARLACIQAAEELFGPESVQVRKTVEAFDAVEISDSAPPTPDPPAIPSVRGPDSTLFVYQDEFGNFRLGRREDALGDPAHGTQLATAIVAAARPSVSRNGEFAVFVNAQNDICFVSTDGYEEDCLGFPGLLYSVAMSPNGQLLGFVLRDVLGNPDNRISVIDLGADEPKTFTLRAPAYDGPGTNTILQADAMDFTLDGQWLVYDALNAVAFSDGSRLRQWSLYALHLNTGRNLALIPPIRGLDIGFPALSQTSDNLLTFDVFDVARNQSTVYAANLNTGELATIATVAGDFSVPGYTGDDTAIVFTQRDPSVPLGFSLFRQPLATDHITPQGPASIWLRNADYGVIYRRPGPHTGLIGILENPGPGSFQSGIGLFSGWVCDALQVEIEMNGTTRLQAAYGTIRSDTTGICGDDNNGFALLFNWNLLGDGTHTVRALADGVEFGTARFTVTTLGTEFLTGASGAYTLGDFPRVGQNVRIDWQQASQNFVITESRHPALSSVVRPANATLTQAATGGLRGTLENPSPGSFQSGIGLFSGWVCDAQKVEIEINARLTLKAGYGTIRSDTAGVCGDTNNGFGLLFNWNLLGDGTHTVRALADGREFGRAGFTVTRLGTEFLTGVSGTYRLPNFPEQGMDVIVEWQQASQNFVITGLQGVLG